MVSFHLRKMHKIAIAALLICCPALFATTTTVTYTASGTFSLISGADLFELRNQPFSMAVVATEGTVPTTSTASYAEYKNLGLKATVQSGLEPTPVSVSNNSTGLVLITGNPTYDFLWIGTGLKVVGKPIGILAKITMRKGTLTNDSILPLTHSVQLTPTSATLTYSLTQPDGTKQESVLGITGNLVTKVTTAASTAAATASVDLHLSGAQAIHTHGDGTKSIRPIGAALVNMGATTDKVSLRFYASGVRDASDVRVEVAGQPVRVLYAGPAAHFAGLDEVMIELPRSLAGAADAEVRLTADGLSASPVHIHIQ